MKASSSGDLSLIPISESGQTNDFIIGIHRFPAWRSALKGQCGEQAGKQALGIDTQKSKEIIDIQWFTKK